MNKMIFTKYSNERARRFSLRTDIVEDCQTGVRCVKKHAMYPNGGDHIRNIQRWYQELSQRYGESGIRLNRCELIGDELTLEYLEGDTLEHVLDKYLLEKRDAQLVDILFAYLEEVKKGFTQENFHITPEFEKVFGHVSLPSKLLCGDVVDIDMVLNNVVVDQGWTLIDYEWTFDFPIPYHFVVYRILTYYLNGSSSRNVLHSLKLMERAGLTQEEIAAYERMERYFQNTYVVSGAVEGARHVPIRDLYDAISPGTVDLTGLRFQDQSEREARKVQLYQAPDLNFTEEHSEKKDLHKAGVFLNYFSIESNSQYVRLDPCSKYCVLWNLQMQWGEEILNYQTNGIIREDGSLFFAVDDPQIIVKRPKGGMGDFRAYFEVQYLDMGEALYQMQKLYGQQRRELTQTKEQLKQKEDLIRSMENTKVWKAYRKIKK